MDIYPEKATLLHDTFTPLFTVALFTIARTWKQPRCPSADDITFMAESEEPLDESEREE